MSLLFDIEQANSISAASCVVNALVEATPISGPAFVNIFQSDSLAMVLVGTLQIVTMPKYFSSFVLVYFYTFPFSMDPGNLQYTSSHLGVDTSGWVVLDQFP